MPRRTSSGLPVAMLHTAPKWPIGGKQVYTALLMLALVAATTSFFLAFRPTGFLNLPAETGTLPGLTDTLQEDAQDGEQQQPAGNASLLTLQQQQQQEPKSSQQQQLLGSSSPTLLRQLGDPAPPAQQQQQRWGQGLGLQPPEGAAMAQQQDSSLQQQLERVSPLLSPLQQQQQQPEPGSSQQQQQLERVSVPPSPLQHQQLQPDSLQPQQQQEAGGSQQQQQQQPDSLRQQEQQQASPLPSPLQQQPIEQQQGTPQQQQQEPQQASLPRAAAPPPPPPQQALAALLPAACHGEENADYGGEEVLQWGSGHLLGSAAECCAACSARTGCNVWVWCGQPGGCGSGAQGECWLKRQERPNYLRFHGIRGPGVAWMSGAVYDEAEMERQVAAEKARLAALREDPELPLVWLDVEIKGRPVGRIYAVAFVREAPRAAENFRQLCTGEAGIAPEGHEGAGQPYHLKGAKFYRIIHEFIDQTGAATDSVYGGYFKDDQGGLALKHDRKGLLSMANTGPDTNGAHMSFMMGPAPHLNGHYTIFGEVVEGHNVLDAINALSVGKPDNTATAADGAVITDAGQVRKGTWVPKLDL